MITGARVWDGVAERPTPTPQRIVVRSGRIASVGPAPPPGEPVAGGDAQQVDLAGHFVMPGLIDAHVHLGLDPTIKIPDEQLAVGEAERRTRMADRAMAMVRAGITTARDLGGGDFMELALRDAIACGDAVGPRVLCAGQPLTRPAGHCHFWGGGAADLEAAMAVVERQLEHGVDWVKVMATGGVFTKGSSVRDAQFDERELTAVCERARRGGRWVAAHCHGTSGIRNAARGGVRTIEHCSFAGEPGFGSDLDPEVVSEIADRGAWVSPTVNLGWGARVTGAEGRPTAFFERMSAVMHGLREAGVPLIASTDAGIPGVAHHRLAEGLLAFQRFAGLGAVELLRTATSGSASGWNASAGSASSNSPVCRSPAITSTTGGGHGRP